MSTYLETLISAAVSSAYRGAFGEPPPSNKSVVRPTDRPEHGDFSSNLALVAASNAGLPPRDFAERLVQQLETSDAGASFREVRVAGPGFVNFFFQPTAVQAALSHLLRHGNRYGHSDLGKGESLQIEFVSSNPTGPLTVGHGRQAVLGDVLANLYGRLGFDVQREYYFNDEGRQIDLLAQSLWVRHRELLGEAHAIPEDGYFGDYLVDIAQDLQHEVESNVPIVSFEAFTDDARTFYRRKAVERMTARIKDDLKKLGVRFDHWFSEATLHDAGKVDAALEYLKAAGGTYEQDGAVWLKAEEHGGVKDSVLQRSDEEKSYTYLMVDIAYHISKHEREFRRVINVQGADHHAEQSCMKAAMRILGYDVDWLSYAVHQFVSLKEGGETLKMSTRAGRFVTLRDLIDELGSDIVRYFMISRKPEAHLDFDLDLARSESLDNPATYVQYAHTRIASIFRNAESPFAKQQLDEVGWTQIDLTPLIEPEELHLIKTLDRFPALVETAALSFAPHLVADYALQLARSFHAYYDRHRVLTDNEPLTRARLALLRGLSLVLRESLAILGVNAPEEM